MYAKCLAYIINLHTSSSCLLATYQQDLLKTMEIKNFIHNFCSYLKTGSFKLNYGGVKLILNFFLSV